MQSVYLHSRPLTGAITQRLPAESGVDGLCGNPMPAMPESPANLYGETVDPVGVFSNDDKVSGYEEKSKAFKGHSKIIVL